MSAALFTERHVHLELELIQSHMAQKPVLRGEVPVYYLASSVAVVGVEDRPPFGGLVEEDVWLAGRGKASGTTHF